MWLAISSQNIPGKESMLCETVIFISTLVCQMLSHYVMLVICYIHISVMKYMCYGCFGWLCFFFFFLPFSMFNPHFLQVIH